MQSPDALSMSPLDTVASLSRSACESVMGYYSQFGKVVADFTRPHLPPAAQIAIETLYNNTPAMVPALICPNFIGKLLIPGTACTLGSRKVSRVLGPNVTTALYDTVFKAVVFNAVCDSARGRGYWASLDVGLAALLYFQKG